MTPSEDRVLNKLREEKVSEAVARIEAFLSHLETRPNSLIHNNGKTLSREDLKTLIAAWNRRADPLVEELRGALIQGAEWFEEYADHHQAKGALDKASRNLERANYLRRREALALPGGGGSACTNLGGEEPDGSFAGEAQRKSEWVRTADRLPAYDRRVLVLTQMGRVFKAYLASGAAETDEGPCDQWIADDEDVCPPCWSDGACWSSNADEEPSDQPVAWAAIPEEVSNVVG